jgi:3-oxoacyl-[acyl-carrier protein] reductase
MDVRGKAAIVTGSATGVGRATALQHATMGCDVTNNYSRTAEWPEQTGADCRAMGARALVVKADVGVDAECRALVEATLGAFGRLDVLINNAGTTSFIPHGDLDAVTDDDWLRIMTVNLKGPFQCVRAARAALQADAGGTVVNVSSIAGIRAIGSSIPYCASKAALNNLTVSLARALAPKIRVNAVAPRFITGRWLARGLGAAYDNVKQHQERSAPLKRVCEPEDVAAAILSLVTGSELITGHVLPVEGGMLIGT